MIDKYGNDGDSVIDRVAHANYLGNNDDCKKWW